MPLYTSEIEILKKELAEIRSVSRMLGFIPKEHNFKQYKGMRYVLSDKVKAYMKYLVLEQDKDLLIYAKDEISVNLDATGVAANTRMYKSEEEKKKDGRPENLEVVEEPQQDDNYFNAPELELIFNRVEFDSVHNVSSSEDLKELDNHVIISLDKIFNYELERIKLRNKSLFNNVALMQKVNRVHSKIKIGKIQEASSLMSRFYNENKQELLLGYLYMELLFAKASLGSQKSLSQARDVANTVCFLTDKSDEALTSYYRYTYVCREYVHDKEKALNLIREFVLFDADRLSIGESIIKRDGFYLKCLVLFLRFDPRAWSTFEIENMYQLVHNMMSGGVFYIYFIREKLLNHVESVRFKKFLQVEIDLFNLYAAHSELIAFIHSNYNKKGIPKKAVDDMNTVSQMYVRNFLTSSKIPNFSEYLANTSISGTQYLEHTVNDKYLSSKAMSGNGFWRTWIAKISYELSLQRPEMLPVELVVQEAKILSKYKSLAEKALEYEKSILTSEEYESVKDMLADVRSEAIMAVVLGENKYNPYTYGLSFDSMKDYYQKLKMITVASSNIVSELILDRGKKGLFWNLEEIQLMLESMNLTLDNKQVGLKARLDRLLNSHDNDDVYQYMSFSEHLSLYWWVYVLLISLLIVLFNMVF